MLLAILIKVAKDLAIDGHTKSARLKAMLSYYFLELLNVGREVLDVIQVRLFIFFFLVR